MRSIRSKLVFILSLSALLSIALESMALFIYKYNQSRPQAVSILSDMAAVMSENLTASLEFDDEASAKSILGAFKNSGRIDGAYLFKLDGSVLAKYEKEGVNKELVSKKVKPFFEELLKNSETSSFDFNSIFLAKQITINDKHIGSVIIVSNTKEMKESLYTQVLMQTTTSLMVLILMILLAFRLQKAFTDPIYALKNAFDTVRLKNDYSAKIDLKTNDEFQSLFDGFGKMLETIKNQKAELEVYTDSLNETIALKTADIQNQKTKLERLLETLDKNVIFSRTDLSGVIIQVSEAFCKISGYAKEELIGRPYSILKHPDMPKSLYDELWSSINSGKIWRGNIKNKRKNGESYWVESVISPEYDDFGYLVGFSSIQQDITAKKEVENYQEHLENLVIERTRELNDERSFANSLTNSQKSLVISTDGVRLRFANKATLEFFDVKNEKEFIDRYGDSICDTFDANAPEGYIQKLVSGKKWIDYINENKNSAHKVVINRNGKKHIFSIQAEMFEFKNEKLSVAVFNDITQIEQAREEIEKILENILLPILITSRAERKILYANKYAEDQYDRPLCELIGADIDNVYTAKGQQEQILELLSKNGRVLNLEENFKTAEGKEFTALLSVIPIVYSGIDCYIGMVTDITEQKRIENEFRILHQHTKESIEYASLLQHSLIPSSDLFKKYFSDHFVIWHPKDIVGGDIYLFDELEKRNECLLFVIDCTGHGVPGAFVTMLVKAIEREIVSQINSDDKTDVSPAWMLSYFNKTMKYLLRQDSDKAISNAGFDGAIIHYNKQNRVLKFAGAQTNLFYVQDGKLNIIKGDRHSIGYKKSNADFKFTEHTIQAANETRIYLTTDGYIDQNGGDKGFPFGKTRFSDMIETNYTESFADQKELFLYGLQKYQKDEIRNDDITLIGFKI